MSQLRSKSSAVPVDMTSGIIWMLGPLRNNRTRAIDDVYEESWNMILRKFG